MKLGRMSIWSAIVLLPIALIATYWTVVDNRHSASPAVPKREIIFKNHWQSSLMLHRDESFYIYVPYYVSGYSSNYVDGLTVSAPLQLDSYHIQPGGTGEFKQYTMELQLHISNPGNYNFQNLSIQIDTIKGAQTLALGQWHFDVLPNRTDTTGVKIISATGGTQGMTKPSDYSYAVAFQNTSKETIGFNGLDYSDKYLVATDPQYSFDDKHFQKFKPNGILIRPGETLYYQLKLKLKRSASGFTMLKPGLKLFANGRSIIQPLPAQSMFTLIDKWWTHG